MSKDQAQKNGKLRMIEREHVCSLCKMKSVAVRGSSSEDTPELRIKLVGENIYIYSLAMLYRNIKGFIFLHSISYSLTKMHSSLNQLRHREIVTFLTVGYGGAAHLQSFCLVAAILSPKWSWS